MDYGDCSAHCVVDCIDEQVSVLRTIRPDFHHNCVTRRSSIVDCRYVGTNVKLVVQVLGGYATTRALC